MPYQITNDGCTYSNRIICGIIKTPLPSDLSSSDVERKNKNNDSILQSPVSLDQLRIFDDGFYPNTTQIHRVMNNDGKSARFAATNSFAKELTAGSVSANIRGNPDVFNISVPDDK